MSADLLALIVLSVALLAAVAAAVQERRAEARDELCEATAMAAYFGAALAQFQDICAQAAWDSVRDAVGASVYEAAYGSVMTKAEAE